MQGSCTSSGPEPSHGERAATDTGAACRYLKLLQTGAHEWKLDGSFTAWLDSMPSVDQRARGPEYYTAPEGSAVKGLRRCAC